MTGGQGQSTQGQSTIGGGRNLAQGEYSVYQPGQLEDLSERRANMQNIQSSTPGVPHLGDSQSFRETVTVASDKQVRAGFLARSLACCRGDMLPAAKVTWPTFRAALWQPGHQA